MIWKEEKREACEEYNEESAKLGVLLRNRSMILQGISNGDKTLCWIFWWVFHLHQSFPRKFCMSSSCLSSLASAVCAWSKRKYLFGLWRHTPPFLAFDFVRVEAMKIRRLFLLRTCPSVQSWTNVNTKPEFQRPSRLTSLLPEVTEAKEKSSLKIDR